MERANGREREKDVFTRKIYSSLGPVHCTWINVTWQITNNDIFNVDKSASFDVGNILIISTPKTGKVEFVMWISVNTNTMNKICVCRECRRRVSEHEATVSMAWRCTIFLMVSRDDTMLMKNIWTFELKYYKYFSLHTSRTKWQPAEKREQEEEEEKGRWRKLKRDTDNAGER